MTGQRSDAPALRASLDHIQRALASGRIGPVEAAHRLSEMACRLLRCPAAALWLLSLGPAPRELHRLGGFDATSNQPLTAALRLVGAAADHFVDSLQGGAFLPPDTADRAQGVRPRTGYWLPDAAGALLDTIVGSSGGALGILCCEQRGARRAWTSSGAPLADGFTAQISTALDAS